MASSVANNDFAGASSLAFPGALTAGSTLVCIAIGDNANATQRATACSDGTNGSWGAQIAEINDTVDGNDSHISIFRFENNASTGTPTVTLTWANGTGDLGIFIVEIDASATPTFTAGQNPTAQGTSGTIDPGDVSITQAENITIEACLEAGYTTIVAADTPFVILDTGTLYWYTGDARALDQGTGTLTCEFGHDAAFGWIAAAALFEVTGGGGATWPLGNPFHRPFRGPFQRGIN
jgi:hypothetical protein